MLKSLPWAYVPHDAVAGPSLRRFVARGLRRASLVLATLARALAHSERRACRSAVPQQQQLEFYAEAGAPEGALYVDGQLVGTLEGVHRL